MTHRRLLAACGMGLAAALLVTALMQARAQEQVPPYSNQVLEGPATLPPGTTAGPCQPWVQVNADAFGLDDPSHQSPPYAFEEGFEGVVFDGALYLGMEADNLYGAQVWRTRPGVRVANGQDDWEQVVGDAFGNAFNNDHIDSLEDLDGYLYASTAVQVVQRDGTEVWRSDDGTAWTQVNVDGFDLHDGGYNVNFKDMLRFTVGDTTYLCGGTGNRLVGAQVWCTTGALDGDGPLVEWTQVNVDGFGSTDTIRVWSTAVFSGYFYVGTERSRPVGGNWEALPGTVWRTDGSPERPHSEQWVWELVYTAPVSERVDIAGVFSDALYIVFAHPTSGTQVVRSGDGLQWTAVVTDGFGDPGNGRLIVDGATVYNGALYLATAQDPHQGRGSQVWRTTDGLAWTNVVAGGWGSTGTFVAELIPFNGYLYAWASDYYRGQRVMRTACPICQSRPVTGTGRFDFSGVGVVITFTEELVDEVEVCVYPGAPPAFPGSGDLIARHVEIRTLPADGDFVADLTLSYEADELSFGLHDDPPALPLGGAGHAGAAVVGAPPRAAQERELTLVRWTGHGWVSCPPSHRAADAELRTVTCRGVTAFSTWAIAGERGGAAGLAVRGLGVRRSPIVGALLLAAALVGLAIGRSASTVRRNSSPAR